jgi:hypothetical protein
MVVAYYFPHNEGVETGIMDKPGMDTGLDLVDLYEVDGQIATFPDRLQAEAWLKKKSHRSHQLEQ